MWKNTRKIVTAALAGMLMVAATPAAAQARPGDGSERSVRSISAARSLLATQFGIKNVKSQKVLQPGSASNGSQVTQQVDVNSALQNWELVVDGSYITPWNVASPRKNMGINGASTASGAVAIVANPSGHFNQDFLMEPRTATEFNLKNRHSGLCLGIDGASYNAGARAMQFPCNTTAPNQRWVLVQ